MRSYVNISHNLCDGNNSRVVPAHSHKTLDSAGIHKSSKSQELPQKPHASKINKPKAARLVQDNQSLSASLTSKNNHSINQFFKTQ